MKLDLGINEIKEITELGLNSRLIKSLAYSNEQETIDFFIKYGEDIEEKYKLKLTEFDFDRTKIVLKYNEGTEEYFILNDGNFKEFEDKDLIALACLKLQTLMLLFADALKIMEKEI